MRAMILSAIAGVLCLVPATPSFAADSCGGGCPKLPHNARSVSADEIPLGDFCNSPNMMTATLAKGRKNTILYADGLLTDGAGGGAPISREYALGINVNGLHMEPQIFGSCGGFSLDMAEDCGAVRADPDVNCEVAGHWWLDMDDPANAALIGVPIAVTLGGGDAFGGPAVGDPVSMSLRVRLEKK